MQCGEVVTSSCETRAATLWEHSSSIVERFMWGEIRPCAKSQHCEGKCLLFIIFLACGILYGSHNGQKLPQSSLQMRLQPQHQLECALMRAPYPKLSHNAVAEFLSELWNNKQFNNSSFTKMCLDVDTFVFILFWVQGTSWSCSLMSFVILGNFSAIISSNLFLSLSLYPLLLESQL